MLSRKKILVVEDNVLNREILKEILAGQYAVLEAGNGVEALDILKQHRDDIALILLDLIMPVMDGFAFLDQLKPDPDLGLIPVIVMTQNDSQDDEVAALAHGATDFVPKPYRPQVILHRIASIINLRETAAMVNQFQFDQLTGLYSREFFYRKVREALDENPDREYIIVCSNIENFKLYNDVFGIDAGDRLLQGIASGLERDGDDIYGRYGADRFMCLHARKMDNVERQRVLKHIAGDWSDSMKNVSLKLGVYDVIDRSIQVEQMCDRALLAADSIKGQYNRYFAIYDDALRGKLLREKALTDAMDSALAENQFQVYLQPKYSLADARMIGAEALVRWIHPEWGFMSPGEFIPLFEKNGFITRLDQYVWERVCAMQKEWRGKGYPPLPVSVNVSRADFYQSDLEKDLLELTERYGVAHTCLNLEVTESIYAESSSRILSTVQRLADLGFTIEMDDFGSGYSSLSLLGQMRLDVLKLDMKFIQNETDKPVAQSILNDIISMAHRLHLKVVAEGVETREQIMHLRALNCDYVQGYFFAAPMPAAKFEALLQEQIAAKAIPLETDRRSENGMRSLLVIDEDDGYREDVRRAFEKQYAVLQAADAESANRLIAEHGGKDIAAIILSATLLENGTAAFMTRLRRDPRLWKVPVVSVIPQCSANRRMVQIPLSDDFLCRCHPLVDLRRRVNRLVEMETVQERESVLQDEANRDFLTGLLNRRGLETSMAAIRKKPLSLAVCLFDLDNLKLVNDTCGHVTGDRMIQYFASLLLRMTRTDDIQCRYGGDEFIVILRDLKDEEDAVRKGEAICRAFSEFSLSEGIPASCSCGIAMCPSGEELSMELIERADQALYHVKRDTKGDCCLWNEQMMSNDNGIVEVEQ